jgi:LmbE family N-acetylglucosaminyl deacetylase
MCDSVPPGEQPPPTMLVTVAHPDDETFGCGSILAHAAACGWRTVVACATRGEAGEATDGSGLTGHALAAIRERELRTAASQLGVERVLVFDWHDSGLDGALPAGAFVATTIDEVAAVIAEVIAEERPRVVITLDGSDGHRDHVHVRDATLRSLDLAGADVERVYLHCLPRNLMQRWVEILVERDPDSNYLALGELGTPDEVITTVVDTAEHLADREAAIAIHETETAPFAAMPDDLRRRFLVQEHLQRIRPPWTGGDRETDFLPAPVVPST